MLCLVRWIAIDLLIKVASKHAASVEFQGLNLPHDYKQEDWKFGRHKNLCSLYDLISEISIPLRIHRHDITWVCTEVHLTWPCLQLVHFFAAPFNFDRVSTMCFREFQIHLYHILLRYMTHQCEHGGGTSMPRKIQETRTRFSQRIIKTFFHAKWPRLVLLLFLINWIELDQDLR